MPRKKRAAGGAIRALPRTAVTDRDGAPEWSPNNRACTATWMALRMLDQSVRPFPSSGAVRMEQLTFFNAAASEEMRRFQAGTIAKQLDNFFRQIDGAKFEQGISGVDALADMTNALLTAEQTMAGLAGVVDDDYRFWEEGE